jgi:hypothetical protein
VIFGNYVMFDVREAHWLAAETGAARYGKPPWAQGLEPAIAEPNLIAVCEVEAKLRTPGGNNATLAGLLQPSH